MQTTLSYWEQKTWYSDHDYCIVGGGIVGMTTALHLRKLEPLAKICIVDRGYLPTGGSTKNAGFMCFGSVSELSANIDQYGVDATLETVRLRLEGLQILRSLTGDIPIDYQDCGGYEVTIDAKSTAALREQIPSLNQLFEEYFGLKQTFKVSKHQISVNGMPCIYNQYEGSIDTGDLITTLVRLCHQAEVLMLPGTEVISYHNTHNPNPIKIQTQSHPITCKSLLLCTNAFTPALVETEIVPQRNQVILTTPVQHQLKRSCYHYHQGYVYFRPIGNQILIGGGRHLFPDSEQTHEMSTTDEVTEWLLNWVKAHIVNDQSVRIAQQWSGILGTGNPLQPIIKQVEPNVFMAAKMNGMGVAIGAKVGKMLAKMVTD